MKCPVCERNLAPTLSICPACGAMIGDTVREELQANISPRPKTVNVAREAPTMPPARVGPSVGAASAAAVAHAPRPEPQRRVVTTDLDVKNTNPTLVGFQSKNATMPDWRLQLQNSVRQRTGGTATASAAAAATAPARVASRAEATVTTLEAAAPPSPKSSDDKLAAALKRIEESRRKFADDEKPKAAPAPAAAAPAAANRNYPFNVVTRTEETPLAAPADMKASVNVLPKPRLVSSLRVGKEVFDTNKLPPLPVPAKVSTSFEKPFSSPIDEISEPVIDEVIHIAKVEEEIVAETAVDVQPDENAAEIEDLAPFAVRFNAGFFDLIIGGFASLMLLAPFVLVGSGNWFTWSGLSAFLATSAVVMFIYLTTCLALFGKTFGMRIFSLELVDVEESDYPTFHQAALNSTIYLISMALGGVGFLTILFNEEKRAVHDLLSGTIVVKEF